MKYEFFLADYKLFPYEKRLALEELNILFESNIEYSESKKCITVVTNKTIQYDDLEKLTYFKLVVVDDEQITPKISLLEKSATSHNRQATRYSAHGIHEYKGKFNPQIVHTLLNNLGANKNTVILDPFCGSGTTLLESSLLGYKSIGYDINPLAVFIANAKQKSLNVDPDDIFKAWKKISEESGNLTKLDIKKLSSSNERIEYLEKWFPEENLIKIENLRISINKLDESVRDILFVLISNNLREYSNQEPGDLRIRKRKSNFPTTDLMDKIELDVREYCRKLNNSKAVQANVKGIGKAYLCNNTEFGETPDIEVDLAITSPPYATALPYIDTQRLSLVWLNLIEPKQIMSLERTLTGTRELRKSEINSLIIEIRENKCKLPIHLSNYLNMLQDALSESDGFRRQAVPALLYNYFSDMKNMFIKVSGQLKRDSYFALVVGTNSTTLGGQKFIIDTPEWLSYIAEDMGWKTVSISKLETYKRYDMHSANSINEETLLILKNCK